MRRLTVRRALLAITSVLLCASGAAAFVATVATPPGASTVPGGITVDADGNLYTADFGGTTLFRINTDGTIESWADGLLTPSGNAFDADGVLYQSNYQDPANPNASDTITRINKRGRKSTYAAGLNGPVGIAVAADGTLFVDMCNSNQIWRVETDGRSSPFSFGTFYNCPNGITFDDVGDLWVVNFNSGDVVQVKPDGSASVFVTTPGGGNGHVVYVAGSLYLTNRPGHRVYRVELDTANVTVFAGSGVQGTVDGDNTTAQINLPNGIARNREGTAIFINEFAGAVRRIDLELDTPKRPKQLKASNVTSTTADLAWKDRDRLEEWFDVEMKQGKGDWEVVETLEWNSTSTTVTGLAPGTKYRFRVLARNGTSASKPSNKARVKTVN